MFFLHSKKDYFSCGHLEHGLTIEYNGIYNCSPEMNFNCNYEPVVPVFGNLRKNYNDFFKKKSQVIKNAKKGNLLERCKTCPLLRKTKWYDSNKINRIMIFANKNCSADCIYCSSHNNKEYFNSLPNAPVYFYIERLIKENKLTPNCNVLFAGGEPVLHFEFEKTMELLISHNVFIRINTSAIEYSKSIEMALEKGICSLVISPDSGCSELYKKIKNVDKYESVVENIKKYCSAQAKSYSNNQVLLKYIIIPNINDEEEFVLDFFKMAENTGCKSVCFDLEFNWYNENKQNKEIIDFYVQKIQNFKNKVKNYGIEVL